MKKKLIFGLLITTLVLVPLLTSCEEETTPTPTKTAAPTTAPTPTATAEAKWWDKFGEPQYGGTITYGIADVMAYNFDVFIYPGAENNFWYETLFCSDWTVDRAEFAFNGDFIPDRYLAGSLVETWEYTDAQTITLHLNQGIKWQNKPPVNGRDFTAYDVKEHYDRIMGVGKYTEPAPMYGGMISNWESVTATDDHTVVFKFKSPGAQNFQGIADRASPNMIEAPEWVAQGDLQNWQTVVGTGPWMLTDLVEGNSATLVRNPDYWGSDPRYPDNQLPYADTLMVMIIPDISTRIAALRTGKIDVMAEVAWQKALTVAESNPEIMQGELPAGSTNLGLRIDMAPFTDINVRKAMQMSINRAQIAESYYGGTAFTVPSGLETRNYKGYAYLYEDWPQELKDEYDYNPERAREILAEAGYPDGFETNVVASTSDDLQLIQIFREYLLDVGIDMEIVTMDMVSKEAFVRSGKHDQMEVRAAAHNFGPDRTIDLFYSQGSDAARSGINDPHYDALRDSFLAATNTDEAAQLFVEIDKYFIEQHWMITSVESSNYNLWQPRLQGYSGERLGWERQMILARLWVE